MPQFEALKDYSDCASRQLQNATLVQSQRWKCRGVVAGDRIEELEQEEWDAPSEREPVRGRGFVIDPEPVIRESTVLRRS
jgi:hypothetical protein